MRGDLKVDIRLGTGATTLDTTNKIVTAGGESIPYDSLIIATGAEPRTLPGADGLARVRTLRTLDDSLAVRTALEAGARTVVVGGASSAPRSRRRRASAACP